MLVRMNIGAYEGKVRDVRNEEARQMIADGRATDLRAEEGSIPPAPGESPGEPPEQPAAAAVPEKPAPAKVEKKTKPPKKRKR